MSVSVSRDAKSIMMYAFPSLQSGKKDRRKSYICT